MARFQFFDGNQGIGRYGEFDAYRLADTARSALILEFDSDLRPFAPTRYPWQIEVALSGARLSPDAEMPYRRGTITDMTYRAEDGATQLNITGLSLDVRDLLADPTGFADLFWEVPHRFLGADDASGPLRGWDGEDIRTGSGDDVIRAGSGGDYVQDWGGSDLYVGGPGTDTLTYSHWYEIDAPAAGIRASLRTGEIVGPDGAVDTVREFENLRGAYGDDLLIGDAGNNRFLGFDGNDTIRGGGGTDTVAYFADTNQGGVSGVTVSLAKGRATDGFGATDRLISIEAVVGTDNDDRFVGDRGDNRFQGRDGADTFVFQGRRFGDDVITDFSEADGDRLRFSAADRDDITLTASGDDLVLRFAEGSVTLLDVSSISSDNIL